MVPPAIKARALPGPSSREGRRELGVPAGSTEIHPKVPCGSPASLADDSNSPEGEVRGGAAPSSPAAFRTPCATTLSVRYILARHTRRSHTDCNPGARAYAHLAGPRHDGGTDWHAHVPQWWPMVLCTLPPHVGKPLPTYVGPAFPGASSCLKHPTDRQACLCRVADRRLVVTGSALLDAHVSLPRWWRVSYAPARPTQDGAGPRQRPSACPRRASAEIPVSQHC